MPKIWIINHYAEVPPYGKYTRHFSFAKKLLERNYTVDIFTASTVHNTRINYIEDKARSLDLMIEHVPVHFVRTRDYHGNTFSRIWNIFDFFLGVQKVVKKYDSPDIIYSSSPHPLNWIASYRIAKKRGAKLVIETRDLWPETFVSMGKLSRYNPFAFFLYLIEKFCYTKADALIFTFQGGNEYLKKRGIIRENVYYINNGIDLNDYSKKLLIDNFEDEDLDRNDIFKVIYTGALGQANEVGTILEAANLMKCDYPEIKFFIFGDGYLEKELKEYKERKELDNVYFKGKVSKKYIPSILSKSSLNLITGKALPIYQYGVSLNKIPEYLASGKPILSNMQVGYDIIVEANAGAVVDPENPLKLFEGILSFYKMEKKEYDKLCANAKDAALKYDMDRLTDSLESAFH